MKDNQNSRWNVNRIVIFLALVLSLVVFVVPFSVSGQVFDYGDVTFGSAGTPHEEYLATQLPAEAGKPVQWVKQVKVQNIYDQAESELIVAVPEDAQNIIVTEMGSNAVLSIEIGAGEITIRDSLEFMEEKSYMIKYETPSPEQSETTLTRDGEALVKNVIVSSEHHYEDVLTYTDIPEVEVQEAEESIRLYWFINGIRTDVTDDPGFDIQLYDTNNNGMYDRMSWVTPHLSTQIFEVVIFSDVDPGSYSNIGLTLLYPSDGEYITSTSRVGFNYSVQYNSSTTVYCNLTVDGDVKRENIPTLADMEITTYFNISSGQHDWNVNCEGSDGASNTSSTRSFTVDLDTPQVTLNTPDYHVSHTNSIQLNFTPVDVRYPVLVCDLSVNGALNQTDIIVNNNTLRTVSLVGLSNGVYDWNVSCEDAAGNVGSSEERVFYISQGTPSDYNISSNKASYFMGESGYLVIDAKPGSNLTMFVSTPLSDSFFEYHNGQTFPLIQVINYTNNAGTYSIDGIFTNGGDMYVVKTSFEVTNSFAADIEANKTTGEPGTEFTFEVTSAGGIGNVSFEWDFDDEETATGDEVTHTFDAVGEYIVEVTATDGKGNKVTDTVEIDVFNKHSVMVIVKELQTQHVLENVAVEIDDERKYTDSKGEANFSVYEGKRRVYVTHPGYEWVKQVRNITGDITITVELNNTGLTNYTPPAETEESSNQTAQQEQDAVTDAETLLSKVSTAIDGLESSDQAMKAVIGALGVESELQRARKELRQIIRDLGNAELSKDLTAEEKKSRIQNITARLEGFKDLIITVEVQDTTEYVDYPKTADISMLSSEYLRYKNLEYSKGQTKDYVEQNTELQKDLTITTRLSIVELTLLSGDTKKASVVINKLTKMPVDTKDTVLIEYVPKEVAESAADITQLTKFEIVKGDPILEFDASLDEYAYYVEAESSIEDLKKTKHVLLHKPAEKEEKGLVGITGFSILPKVKNPKLFAEVVIILLLLIAYLVYHFELIDKVREWRGKKDPGKAPYETDMAYKPESTIGSITRKVKTFVRKEDEKLMNELAHIRALMTTAHRHAADNQHDRAAGTYKDVMDAYTGLSQEAKSGVHHETTQVYNSILLSKAEHLLNEAFVHISNKQHDRAKDHYSEIKEIYPKLEKEHRAAVSERCMKLHARLFETSLT
jgi:hypothetical protein